MPAISIVIPVHNAQGYIHRFVASLQAQTFGDFEALFVDDASPDETASILAGLASSDPRLKLLRHPRNLGAGAARNNGIRAAAGETLCFADPDDFLPPPSLEARYSAYKKHNAIVRACHDEIAADGTLLTRETRPEGLPPVFKPTDVAQQFGVNPFLCAHWTWLLPTKMLQRMGIFNEEGTRTAEDIMFLVRLYFNVSKLVWIPETVYHWMKRTDSLSNTFYTNEHYFDYLKCVDVFYDEAARNRRIDLADSFCNDHLGCYISHLLMQIAHGKSTESDAQTVIREMARTCARHGVPQRCFPRMQANVLFNSGFFLLWNALTDGSPSMTERLVKGQNAITRLYEQALQSRAEQGGNTHG